jgi:hypothetical protein
MSGEKITTEEKLKLVNESLNRFTEELAPVERKLVQLKRDIEKATLERSKLMEKLLKEKEKEIEKQKIEAQKLEKKRLEKEKELEKKKIENEDLALDKWIIEERLKSKSAKASKVEELEKCLKKTQTELCQHKETIKNIAKVSTMSTNPNSCIYLFNLGTTEELKSLFKIPNEQISNNICIYKFGLTNDINRRENEHGQKFIQKGCKNFKRAFTKPSSIIVNRSNENKLFNYFRDNKYTFISEEISGKDKYKELICIDTKDYKKVIQFFEKDLE